MSAGDRRWLRRSADGELASARDLFAWLVGGVGLLFALITGLVLAQGSGGRGWLTVAAPLSAAVVALLAVDLLWALFRHRRWATLLPRLALLLLNGVFCFAELLALVAALGTR